MEATSATASPAVDATSVTASSTVDAPWATASSTVDEPLATTPSAMDAPLAILSSAVDTPSATPSSAVCPRRGGAAPDVPTRPRTGLGLGHRRVGHHHGEDPGGLVDRAQVDEADPAAPDDPDADGIARGGLLHGHGEAGGRRGGRGVAGRGGEGHSRSGEEGEDEGGGDGPDHGG